MKAFKPSKAFFSIPLYGHTSSTRWELINGLTWPSGEGSKSYHVPRGQPYHQLMIDVGRGFFTNCGPIMLVRHREGNPVSFLLLFHVRVKSASHSTSCIYCNDLLNLPSVTETRDTSIWSQASVTPLKYRFIVIIRVKEPLFNQDS